VRAAVAAANDLSPIGSVDVSAAVDHLQSQRPDDRSDEYKNIVVKNKPNGDVGRGSAISQKSCRASDVRSRALRARARRAADHHEKAGRHVIETVDRREGALEMKNGLPAGIDISILTAGPARSALRIHDECNGRWD